ncbi:uncharacterized protein J7T54_003387 [Emericellopsis cladophorae]|uniref:ARCA protein n=1 Tax=Emericellopsis cladophorae TaxID=2686198 RepID=A0A9P9XW21_9HYPO|nr:uncharacterized protein J7T54_003387 [Emericellopsis cladophorae]KAI6778608.1 hypothetical protein J7T54_003387 [Emericellopsis cladophorae]
MGPHRYDAGSAHRESCPPVRDQPQSLGLALLRLAQPVSLSGEQEWNISKGQCSPRVSSPAAQLPARHPDVAHGGRTERVPGRHVAPRKFRNAIYAIPTATGAVQCLQTETLEVQPWVRTSRTLSFVDETKDIANLDEYRADYLDGQDDDDDHEEAVSAGSPASVQASPQLSSPSSPPPGPPEQNRGLQGNGASTVAARDPLQAHVVPGDLVMADAAAPSKSIGSILSDLFSLGVSNEHQPDIDMPASLWSPQDLALVDGEAGAIYLESSRWPLRDPEEAMLFRYYIDSLSPLLDMCDEENHFARIVPLRAATCCPLYHAILAYAAKRLSRLGGYDSVVADRYHQKCLNALIPALSDAAAVADENLLTSLILLRSMEELDVPISTPSPEFHLMGTRVFLEAQRTSCDFTGLRLASFWIALRQEIYIAFINSRPVRSDFALNNFDWLSKPDMTGCNTANCVIIYCAACLRYCYGAEELTVEGWDELRRYLEAWWDARPWHFTPLYTDRAEDGTLPGFLPDERYANSAVVTGLQHYHLAKMLLAAHSPTIPKLGFGRRRALDAINDEIKDAVRAIVGIAESNQHTPPAYVTASMAITMAGDCFTERSEQQVLHDVMLKTDRELAWPTHSARQALVKSWGWDQSPDDPTPHASSAAC